MQFTLLTIFPEMFAAFSNHGIVGRAVEAEKVRIEAVDIRRYTTDRHHTTDDRPFGGGCGMVMKPEPLAAAIRDRQKALPGARVIHLSPQGRLLTQQLAWKLAAADAGLILVCGRYEGIDERIVESLVDEEISIGDYVLSGGELPAMVLMDSVIRLIPGVLGGAESASRDSFSNDLLEHAHYTRPRVFEAAPVPDVLLSGNHAAIEKWRFESALFRTVIKRPDLLTKRPLRPEERELLDGWRQKIERLIHTAESQAESSVH